jgi:hypothetical protein
MTLDLHPYVVEQFHDQDCIMREKPARPVWFPIVTAHKVGAYPMHFQDGVLRDTEVN